MNFFKIRHNPSGTFKMAGINSQFSINGKFWPLKHLKSHLRLFKWTRKDLTESIEGQWKDNGVNPEDCDVVEYKMVEVSRTPLKEFISKHM